MIRKIAVFLILGIFLYTVTGVSVWHHHCNSSREDHIAFYPELFGTGSSCCGEEETMPQNYSKSARQSDHQAVEEAPCCKSTLTFLKADILPFTPGKTRIGGIESGTMTPNCQINLFNAVEPEPKPVWLRFHSPPPVYGKKLIHFLHQIKIPARHLV